MHDSKNVLTVPFVGVMSQVVVRCRLWVLVQPEDTVQNFRDLET